MTTKQQRGIEYMLQRANSNLADGQKPLTEEKLLENARETTLNQWAREAREHDIRAMVRAEDTLPVEKLAAFGDLADKYILATPEQREEARAILASDSDNDDSAIIEP